MDSGSFGATAVRRGTQAEPGFQGGETDGMIVSPRRVPGALLSAPFGFSVSSVGHGPGGRVEDKNGSWSGGGETRHRISLDVRAGDGRHQFPSCPCKAPIPALSVIFCAQLHFYGPRSFSASTPTPRRERSAPGTKLRPWPSRSPPGPIPSDQCLSVTAPVALPLATLFPSTPNPAGMGGSPGPAPSNPPPPPGARGPSACPT